MPNVQIQQTPEVTRWVSSMIVLSEGSTGTTTPLQSGQ